MRNAVSVRFVKRGWGGNRPSWRRVGASEHYRDAVSSSIRKLTNRQAKVAWFGGTSIKAY